MCRLLGLFNALETWLVIYMLVVVLRISVFDIMPGYGREIQRHDVFIDENTILNQQPKTHVRLCDLGRDFFSVETPTI